MSATPQQKPSLWAVVRPWAAKAAYALGGAVVGAVGVEVARRIDWRADEYRAEVRALVQEARRREREEARRR